MDLGLDLGLDMDWDRCPAVAPERVLRAGSRSSWFFSQTLVSDVRADGSVCTLGAGPQGCVAVGLGPVLGLRSVGWTLV